MVQDYTVYIYKLDRRYKSGERIHNTSVWSNRDEAEMHREVRELQYQKYPTSKFRIEFFPTMKTVKNLMTGQYIQIAQNTPRSCDPSSEQFWSM